MARIVVLGGGESPEAQVSLISSKNMHAGVLEKFTDARLIVLEKNELPAGLDPQEDVIFPVLHGKWGEDGGIQKLLEARGFHYVGSDAKASALCMDKLATKDVASGAGVRLVPGSSFRKVRGIEPDHEALVEALGESLVLKAARQGSSLEMHFTESLEELKALTPSLRETDWVVEKRIRGTDLTLGLFEGKALSIVKIQPVNSVHYAYENKYTAGMANYECPAKFPEALTQEIKAMAEAAYAAAGCRDYARIDFILSEEDGKPYFLEINTIPGYTPMSGLPQSAEGSGISRVELSQSLAQLAINRHNAALSKLSCEANGR